MMYKSKRSMALFAAVMVMLAFFVIPAAAAVTEIDLRTADAEVYHNGAWFHQSPYVGSAGTGVLDPFLRVSANKEIVKGYNTDYRPLQFDEDASWTESLLLSTVPTIEIKGGYYREFRLDINQVNSKPYLSLDVLKLYLVNAPNINHYDPATGKFGGASYPLVYDLDAGGDAVVLMNYALEAGSGVSDVVMLIPESVFDAFPECDYGQQGCNRWIYLYNEFGAYGPGFVNNDGFEEWATQILPYVQVEKTAEGSRDRTCTWKITKDYDATYDLFAGQSKEHGYNVSVDKDCKDGNYKVSGTIKITVPAKLPDGDKNSPDAVVTSIVDRIDGRTATVTCPSMTPFTVKAGTSVTCTYTASSATSLGNNNTVTVTVKDNPFPFSAKKSFTYKENLIGYDKIDVTDTNGESWVASDDASWNYKKIFDCSSDPAKYTDGKYSYTHTNTARITQTGASDNATVTVNCYAPVVTKDATPEFNRTYKWKIDKVVNPTNVTIKANEYVDAKYCVTVSLADPAYSDDGWKVSGKIYVKNPAPMLMTLSSVTDMVSPNIAAAVTCPSLTIPAGGTLTCTYSATLLDGNERVNTATATMNSIKFTGTAKVNFTYATMNEKDRCVNVTDDREGSLGTVCKEDAPKKFEYTTRYYGKDLNCAQNCIPNTASFKAEDTGATGSDDAEICIHVLCDLPRVCAIKYHDLNANGKRDDGEPFLSDWEITLKYKDGTPSYTQNTDGNGTTCFSLSYPDDPEGDWYLSETLKGGWVKSEPTADSYMLNLVYGGPAIPDNYFGNYKNVSVKACKLEDVDNNPATSADRVPVKGWKVYLSIDGVRQLPGQETGEDGCYTWDNLKPGVKYDVEEDVPSDWYAWTDTKHDFGMSASGDEFSYTFINSKKVNVKVCKLEDQDGDLDTTDDRDPVNGWIVFLTKNGHVQDTKITGDDGCYEWKNLDPLVPPNYYDAAEYIYSGWYRLTQQYMVCDHLNSGETCTVTFVNSRYGSKAGYKWEDVNENQVWDSGEKGLEGWVIELWDEIGKVTEAKTDANGYYEFTNLDAGKTYYVCEQIQDGWTQTYPTSGFACPASTPALGKYGYEIKLKSGEVDRDNNFGNSMPKNLYCGLTIGFWKENIDKYLCNWTSGRQVCDEFYTGVSPAAICDVSGYGWDLCNCGSAGTCENWSCIYNKVGDYDPRSAREKAEAQMIAMKLTNEFYADDFEDFILDMSEYPWTCSNSTYGAVSCTDNCTLYEDFTCSCNTGYSCYIDPCANVLYKACDNSASCDVSVAWGAAVEAYNSGKYSMAYEIADCVNNYKFGCCDYSYGKPEYFGALCDGNGGDYGPMMMSDGYQGCCYPLEYCYEGHSSFNGSGCLCAYCHMTQCYGIPPATPTPRPPKPKTIQIKLLEPLFDLLP